MNFHILTLFPEMSNGGTEHKYYRGVRLTKGLISVEAVNIRDSRRTNTIM